MNPQDETRGRFGGRAGCSALGLLLCTALLVSLYVYRHEIILTLILGQVDLEWAQEVEQETNTGHESAEAIVSTGKGFTVLGHTNSLRPGVREAWVLQFDGAPPPRWERTYGKGKLGTSTLGRAIASLPGGRLVIAGEEGGVGGFQGWLLALSPEGSALWERTPGQVGVNGLNAVAVLEDGSVVAGGREEREGWVVRMDSQGQLIWKVRLPLLDRVTDLVALPAQRVAVVGTAESSTSGLGLARLMLLGSDGRALGEKQLPTEGKGELYALALLPDGGLVATGSLSRPDSSDKSFWVVRLELGGEILWEHVLEESGFHMEAGRDIAVFSDGGIAVVGSSLKEMSEHEAKVWRFSADGRLLWQRSYGGAGTDMGAGIARLEDESLMVVGMTTSPGAGKTDMWLFGLSPQGQLLWEETFGAP
jgi:hypothetical protein